MENDVHFDIEVELKSKYATFSHMIIYFDFFDLQFTVN